ncbi:hypothetical protein ACI65C_006614 [Semiaphis heraclei]
MEWSQDKTLQLIESYRLHPVLWNCKLSDYKHRDKRHDAWNEIANSLNVDKDEVERKIKNLSSHFARESKRVREEKIANTKSGKMIDVGTESVISKTNNSSIVSEDFAMITREPSNKTSGGKKRSTDETQIPSRKKNKDDLMVNEAYSIMKKLFNERNDRNEYHIFGEQVGCKVSKLPTNYSKIILNPITNSSPLTVNPAFNNYSYGIIPSTSTQHQSFNIHPSIENNNFSTSWPSSSSSLQLDPPDSQQIDYTSNNVLPQSSKAGEMYNKDYYC